LVEFSTDSFMAEPISRTISFASSSISIWFAWVCYAKHLGSAIGNRQ
jgi:hypothetical protein